MLYYLLGTHLYHMLYYLLGTHLYHMLYYLLGTSVSLFSIIVVLFSRHTSVSSPISKSQEESHEESHELSVDAPTLDATSQVKREHYHNTPSICVENEPKVE